MTCSQCTFPTGPKECPVFPTELAFAIDTSSGVVRDVFNRMKQTVLRVVNNLTIAESNCPRGARVALVTYNNEVTTEIRFADAKKKSSLLQQIQNFQATLTTKPRSLETAMSFVARNTFKRARSGFLMRKVAVFFSNGDTRASPQLNDAVLKLYDAGVVPVFLTSRQDAVLARALEVGALHPFSIFCSCPWSGLMVLDAIGNAWLPQASQVWNTALLAKLIHPLGDKP